MPSMSEKEVDNLGKKLFNKTSYINNYGDELYFYDADKLDYSNISNESKLAVTIANISDGDFYEDLKYEMRYSFSDDGYIYEDLHYVKSISKKKFEESYKELFGNDENVKYEDFNQNDYTCSLKNDSVECNNYTFYARGSAGQFYLSYDKAEYIDNSIIVYTSLLGYNNWNASDKGAIYNDYNLSNQIDDRYIEDNVEETLFRDYGDKASKYKLTFNQDNNGNWYWVSTELVK